MSAIIIKADLKSNKLLSDLAKRLGGDVITLKDKELEDFALGILMNKVKTNENVSRDEVMKKLRK